MNEQSRNWTYWQLGLLLQGLSPLGGIGMGMWGIAGSAFVLAGARGLGGGGAWGEEGEKAAQGFFVGAILCMAGEPVSWVPLLGWVGSLLWATGCGFELAGAVKVGHGGVLAGVPGNGTTLLAWGIGLEFVMHALGALPFGGLLAWPMAMVAGVLLVLSWLRMQSCRPAGFGM